MRKALLVFIATGICLATAPTAQARVTCQSFKTQAEAQAYFNRTKAKSLDRDNDGIACENGVKGSSSKAGKATGKTGKTSKASKSSKSTKSTSKSGKRR